MKFFLISLFVCFSALGNVSANDGVYYNKNGVALTPDEVAYVDAMFYESYKDNLTKEEYNLIFKNGVPNIDLIESKELIEYNALRDVSYSTANKKITLKKVSGGSYYNISIVLNWLSIPKVKSYDVIGARFNTSTNATDVITKVESNGRSRFFNNIVKNSYGIGGSVLLNDNDSNIIVSQYFNIPVNTRVTASYQHATSSISLADSMNYGFSANGLGGVFAFNNGIASNYDGMRGVYLD